MQSSRTYSKYQNNGINWCNTPTLGLHLAISGQLLNNGPQECSGLAKNFKRYEPALMAVPIIAQGTLVQNITTTPAQHRAREYLLIY